MERRKKRREGEKNEKRIRGKKGERLDELNDKTKILEKEKRIKKIMKIEI